MRRRLEELAGMTADQELEAEEPDREDDLPDWLRESTDSGDERTARTFQFSIASLMWLMTVCGVYVYLERTHGGLFGIHALAAIGLIFGIGLPVIFFLLWLLHLLLETGPWLGLALLGLAIMGIVAGSLFLFPGF
jgi:hypothetical protein